MARVHDCDYCGVRLILARSAWRAGAPPKPMPALNACEDPLGTVAAQHLASGAWVGRFLAKDEEPVVPEKRYSVHECEGTRHAAQRAQVKAAQSALARAQRNQRGHRPGPQVTGVVVQPEQLPGMDGQ